MRNSMSISNLEYAVLKQKSGLHNWGFCRNRYETHFELDEIEEQFHDPLALGQWDEE